MLMIDRKIIIRKLVEQLSTREYIRAAWLAGADSLEIVDEYSDIDLWIDVESGSEDNATQLVRDSLKAFCEIDYFFERKSSDNKKRQILIHLKGTPKFLILDIIIQTIGDATFFRTDTNNENPMILFDKKGVIKIAKISQDYKKKLLGRRKYLLEEYSILRIDVEKEIAKNNYFGAVHYYLILTKVVVELLRIKYYPIRYDVGLKHATHDFPKELLPKIRKLFQFQEVEDVNNRLEIMDSLIRKV